MKIKNEDRLQYENLSMIIYGVKKTGNTFMHIITSRKFQNNMQISFDRKLKRVFFVSINYAWFPKIFKHIKKKTKYTDKLLNK